MFAEAGIFALLVTAALLLTPVALGGDWRSLVAGFVMFNMFYQTPTEPAFWFILAMAWLTLRVRVESKSAARYGSSEPLPAG
jgi:hypothetical protein